MLIIIDLHQSQATADRFDATTYETQLLAVLEECAPLAEKHNRDLVPHFLAVAGPDAPSRLPRNKLSAWLKLFAKFSNPNALRATETMRALYVSLLAHPDRALQRLALSCLLTYKSPRLVRHEDSLQLLLDDTKWRDQLTLLDFAQFGADERPEVVSVVIRLLYGTMLERRGRTRGADKRAAVLSSLAACSDDELTLLVDLMLQPMRSNRSTDAVNGAFAVNPVPDDVSEKQQLGFLTLLGDVLKHLGSQVVAHWPSFLETVRHLGLASRRHGHRDDRVHSRANVASFSAASVTCVGRTSPGARPFCLRALTLPPVLPGPQLLPPRICAYAISPPQV